MNLFRDKSVLPELVIILGLVVGVVISGVCVFGGVFSLIDRPPMMVVQGSDGLYDAMTFKSSRATLGELEGVSHPVFSSELRVSAIGSAYPIPFAAEVCPFSGIPQPGMRQLDRDEDGMTDGWELRHDLDKNNASDASADFDLDGFSNLEEFRADTHPLNAASHPPYALKLRFLRLCKQPFPLIFKGFTELADGSVVFQVNVVGAGKTHFVSVGDEVEGVVVQRFVAGEIGEDSRLIFRRGDLEIELVRGKTILDPESKVEVINILDQSRRMVTMGALLSLCDEEYVVLGVYPDRVVIRQQVTQKVFDITGLADEER